MINDNTAKPPYDKLFVERNFRLEEIFESLNNLEPIFILSYSTNFSIIPFCLPLRKIV